MGSPAYGDLSVDSFSWMKDLGDGLLEIWQNEQAPTPESAVLVTNLDYYYGDNESSSPVGMGFLPLSIQR
jgi:hypothetical protein